MANTNNESQPYDRSLQSLMDDHAAEIIPELIPGASLIAEQNSEIVRTNLRADGIQLIKRNGKASILHIEWQTDSDSNMTHRMLLYYVELVGKYQLPITSLVVYLFETTFPEPIFQNDNGLGTAIDFQHQVECLWQFEAESYLRQRKVYMYMLMPGMKGVTASMLLQAIDEMQQRYTRAHLTHRLWRFKNILQRSTMLTQQDKKIVEERLHMLDKLLDEDPEIQRRMALAKEQGKLEGKLEGEIKGEIKGKLEGAKQILVDVTEARFPALVELAKQQVIHIDKTEDLSKLSKLIVSAPDENVARWLLTTYTA